MDHETARVDLRVRLDECDGTRTARPGVLLSLADEARFGLYDRLHARGVVLPRRQAVRAESLRVVRSPSTREALVLTAHVGRVGRTSFDIVHRATTPAGEPLFALVATLVGLVDGSPEPVDASLAAQAAEPLDLALGAPEDVDSGAAFVRTYDALRSSENQGRHVARTRMVEWLDDLRRLAAEKGAFEHEHPSHGGLLTALSLVYSREVFAGDGLRAAISAARPTVLDAKLVRGHDEVARARFFTGSTARVP